MLMLLISVATEWHLRHFRSLSALAIAQIVLFSVDLLRGAYEYGIEKPSAIRQGAIAPLSAGLDIVVQVMTAGCMQVQIVLLCM